MTINQLSIFVENKAGTVAEITKSIAEGLKNKNYPDDRCYTFSKVTEAIAYANSLEAGKKKYVLLENDLPDNY